MKLSSALSALALVALMSWTVKSDTEAAMIPPDCPDLLLCDRESGPVCASNNITFPGECDFVAARCFIIKYAHLTIAHMGACERSNLEFIHPDCPGFLICDRESGPVCGSNDVTYANACELVAANCVAGFRPQISLKHVGRC